MYPPSSWSASGSALRPAWLHYCTPSRASTFLVLLLCFHSAIHSYCSSFTLTCVINSSVCALASHHQPNRSCVPSRSPSNVPSQPFLDSEPLLSHLCVEQGLNHLPHHTVARNRPISLFRHGSRPV
ncbi:uncharacterized protein BDZ99DRAFT_100760 [Mytilinidion resinicola]|uniref:Uncharacterized protein n=1 Tax=Mytilinidion resinicola TaxID=574789 RepID=A0A6A6YD90_9PEZI|nr:uncharacterized protein BDZ99DRAFT_100760 [Mytilinidion resinicola]KAF2805964.1 hypothetical protein BDZ99DRAFT_100760 [Mytilinidion resinicola]